MMHMLGAGLLILAGGLFAKSKTAGVKAQLSLLSAISAALTRMSGEIRSNLTPVGEIIEALAADRTASASFFGAVHGLVCVRGAPYLERCWCDAVDGCCACLSHREQDVLRGLGRVLGRCDAPEECAAIDRCVVELLQCRDDLQARFTSDARLYAGLGLAAGCILAIVLL